LRPPHAYQLSKSGQLEVPDWTVEVILDWLATDGRIAAIAAADQSGQPLPPGHTP